VSDGQRSCGVPGENFGDAGHPRRRLSQDFALGFGDDAGGRVAEGGVILGGDVTQHVIGGRNLGWRLS
jgi:hypothetical protein